MLTKNAGGSYSYNQLPPLDVRVGCNQIMNLQTSLRIGIDPYPQETQDSPRKLTDRWHGNNSIRESSTR